MNDQQYVIELEDDVEGHLRRALRFVPEDPELSDALKGQGPGSRIRLAPADEQDTEGHATLTAVRVQAFLDEDDTEGHAISVHFPSREEADAFRRRLVATGVIAATVAIGAVGAGALSSIDTGPSAINQGVVSEQAAAPNRDAGLMDASGAAITAAAAAQAGAQDPTNRDIGIMDASGAASDQTSSDREEPPDQRVGPR